MPEDGDEGLVDAVLFGLSDVTVTRRTLARGVRLMTAGSHPLTEERVFESVSFAGLLRRLAQDSLVLVLRPT